MTDRATFVRDRMLKQWSGMIPNYTRATAGNTERYAELLLEAVSPRPGEHVLDLATGPGVVAVMVADGVGPNGRVIATDLAPEWGEVVDARAREAGLSNVEFRAMSADALDLPDASFDLALCQFGLMFVPEPVQALREMRRVLREGGRMGAAVWSTGDKVKLFTATAPVLQPYMPQIPPDQQMPTSLQLGEPGLIERLVGEAGFRDIRSQRHTLGWVVQDPEMPWRAIVLEGPPPLRAAILALPEAEQVRVHDAFVAALEAYREDGEIRLPSEAIIVTATR